MKELLEQMFRGWMLHEASWNSTTEAYARAEVDCMIEVCSGDNKKGMLLSLFGYWSNDIQSIAAHYGLQIEDGQVKDNVPPAPSDKHFWHEGKWCLLNEHDEIEN